MSEPRDKPGYSFAPGPPPDVSRFFANKSLRPSFSWLDVEPEEHAVAFAVAKMAHIDQLQAVKNELQKAIDSGLTFDQFQKNFRANPALAEWWGYGEALDPATGQRKPARLGTPRRLKTIYRANLRSARAAGQWERIQRNKRALPYLLYQLGPSEVHRPHHEAKEGLVLPADDPFWEIWFPPNGYGCNCWVRQITRREADERGVDDRPDIPMRDVENTRTGEIKRVPVGIDPGWDGNPGAFRLKRMQEMLAGKLDVADPAIARAAARDMASSWRAQRILEGSAPGAVPIAMLTPEIASALGARTRVVQFSDYTANKSRERHPEVTAETLPKLADVLETGAILKETSASGTVSLILEGGGARRWRLVVKRTRDAREIFVSTFHRVKPGLWEKLLARPTTELLRE